MLGGYLQSEKGDFFKFEGNYIIELKKYIMKLEKSMEVIHQNLNCGLHVLDIAKIKLIKPVGLTKLKKHNWFYCF